MAHAYGFSIDSMIHACEHKLGNSHDPYVVAVKKVIGGEAKVVGHVPRNISAICSLFINNSM